MELQMENFNISIIVPVYNAKKYLFNCLTSLINQTMENYEIICVDNGSTDGSLEILYDFQEKNIEKLRVLSEKRKGVWFARLTGIENANGKYIAFCDSDDIVESNMLEKMYIHAIETDSDICICGFDRIDSSNKCISKEMNCFRNETYKVENNFLLLPLINTSMWNKIIKRELFNNVIEFDTPPRVMEDAILLLSIYPFAKNISFIDDILYHYYVRDGSAMSYVLSTELEDLFQCLEFASNWVLNRNINKQYKQVISLMALIHLGASLPIRMISSSTSINKDLNRIRAEINFAYPECYNIKYRGINKKYRKKYRKIYLIRYLFNTKLYSMVLFVYKTLTACFHIDIKW